MLGYLLFCYLVARVAPIRSGVLINDLTSPSSSTLSATSGSLSPVLLRPARAAGLVPEQRPAAGEMLGLSSHAFEDAIAGLSSLNPASLAVTANGDATILAELSSRLVIGIGMGVRSRDAIGLPVDRLLANLELTNISFPSFFQSAQPNFIYRFYIAFDENDPFFEDAQLRAALSASFEAMRRAEDARRWHPSAYIPEKTVDASSLLASLHYVHCNYAHKPSWAHNDAIMVAYKEGADYAFRTNDDTAFPVAPDWVDRMIADLRSRPLPNLGVTGPACDLGANRILTHDFTHKTHDVLFGFHYPRSLPDWSSDDWITVVYRQYGEGRLMTKREDARVDHRGLRMRYQPQSKEVRLLALNAEVEKGANAVDAFTKLKWNLVLPHKKETITCC